MPTARLSTPGEGEDAPVERARLAERQQAARRPGHGQGEHPAGGGEEQALGHQLANQPPARGADRHADRHLPSARPRPRQQQGGHVGAHDEQHEGDDDAEDAGLTRRLGARVVEALPAGRDEQPRLGAPVPVPREPPLLLRQAVQKRRQRRLRRGPEHPVQVALHLGRRRPRRQPSHDREPPERRVRETAVAFRQPQGGEGQMHVGRRRIRPANARVAGRQHAHDGGGDVVHADDRARGVRLRAEPAFPEPVADHGHRLGPRPVVVGNDGAAGGRLHAEHAEVVAGDGEAGRGLGPSVDDEGQRRRRRREHPGEGLVGVTQGFEDGVGEGSRDADSPGGAGGPHAPRRAVVAGPAQAHEAVGVRHRQRPEEHAVYGAEQRGVGADAQRERDQHHERPALGLLHAPYRGANVVEEALGRSPAPSLTGQLADERHVAEVAPGGGACLLGVHPSRHQLLGLVGEMKSESPRRARFPAGAGGRTSVAVNRPAAT